MKKYILIVCLFCLQFLMGQNSLEKLEKLNQYELLKEQEEYERVYIEVGLVKPIGNLSNKFDVSQCYGFWFRSKIKNNDFIDIGLNVVIPNNASNINVKYKDSVFSIGSRRFGGNLGFRFAKVFPFSNVSPRNNVEWFTGFGVATMFYDANHKRYEDIINGNYDAESSEKSYEFALTTLQFSQGIKMNIKNVGLQFNYQFTPYGLFENRIEPNFGSQSIMFGIYYRQ